MSYCIYTIKDLRNDVIVYVGKTNNFNNRRRCHFTDKRTPIDKYMFDEGREHFEMSIIQDDIESNDAAVKSEDTYILELDPILNKRRSGHIKNDDPNEYKKEYAKTEKAKEYNKEYYQKNKEQKLSYQKQYNQKNKDYYLEYQRQYRLKKKQQKSPDMITLF